MNGNNTKGVQEMRKIMLRKNLHELHEEHKGHAGNAHAQHAQEKTEKGRKETMKKGKKRNFIIRPTEFIPFVIFLGIVVGIVGFVYVPTLYTFTEAVIFGFSGGIVLGLLLLLHPLNKDRPIPSRFIFVTSLIPALIFGLVTVITSQTIGLIRHHPEFSKSDLWGAFAFLVFILVFALLLEDGYGWKQRRKKQ